MRKKLLAAGSSDKRKQELSSGKEVHRFLAAMGESNGADVSTFHIRSVQFVRSGRLAHCLAAFVLIMSFRWSECAKAKHHPH